MIKLIALRKSATKFNRTLTNTFGFFLPSDQYYIVHGMRHRKLNKLLDFLCVVVVGYILAQMLMFILMGVEGW